MFVAPLLQCLITCALTPLLSAASVSFELVDGVVELLHRDWRHCVLELLEVVLVFALACLRR